MKKGLLQILMPYRKMVLLLAFFTLIGNGMNLIIPRIISRGIDDYTAGNFNIRLIIIQFFVAAAVIFIFTFLQNIVQTFTSEKVALDIRGKLSSKISRQSYAFIRGENTSRLLTNMTSDVDALKMFVSQAVSTIISSVFIILGTSVLLLTINWKLALPVILLIPSIGSLFYIVQKKVRVLFKRSREVIDWLNKVINESILGSAIIRVLNSQHHEYRKFIAANTEAKDIGISILTMFATIFPLMNFIANLATLVILSLGGHFVINGALSLGDFAAFNSYVTILIFPIIIIGFMSNVIANSAAAYDRIEKVLNAAETSEKGVCKGHISGAMTVRDVTLNYGGRSVLRNISFDISPGSRTAIIGPTAAGKSQLLYVLSGLIRPDAGTVLYDGVDLGEYDKEYLLSKIGIVFQDSVIFSMSLRENIAFSEYVTDESLEQAVETAEIHDFISTLPEKLDTIVAERGTSLSGGQKQRIMLARALAYNPAILLLDDFTARVDRNTEQKILCNIEYNYRDLTLITVTQKISPVKHYDQIILLMEGEIIASGKHDDLLETCPEYVQIYNSQMSTSHYELRS